VLEKHGRRGTEWIQPTYGRSTRHGSVGCSIRSRPRPEQAHLGGKKGKEEQKRANVNRLWEQERRKDRPPFGRGGGRRRRGPTPPAPGSEILTPHPPAVRRFRSGTVVAPGRQAGRWGAGMGKRGGGTASGGIKPGDEASDRRAGHWCIKHCLSGDSYRTHPSKLSLQWRKDWSVSEKGAQTGAILAVRFEETRTTGRGVLWGGGATEGRALGFEWGMMWNRSGGGGGGAPPAPEGTRNGGGAPSWV